QRDMIPLCMYDHNAFVVSIGTGGIVSKCSAISGIFESSLILGRSVSCRGINCIDADNES
ncbi:MAG: hypothetical protein PHF57_14275, partial [Methanoregula sp.]|nr:hypothetical protein [Methanoregula sp.]